MKKPNLYNTNSIEPFKISRSKIDLFLECPRCFYLDRKLGISRPSGPGFSLNSAVDALLKKEFDVLRENKESHALMKKYSVDAVPYQHPDINIWRENFKGKEYLHPPTNLLITGAIDDIWENPSGELFIVDYKSTSTAKEISLDDQYKQGYKKQMEVYQWIFRMGGFNISNTGYFVFANAGKDKDIFDAKLDFVMSIISYEGNSDWVEPTIFEIKKCLDNDSSPIANSTCQYCNFVNAQKSVIL